MTADPDDWFETALADLAAAGHRYPLAVFLAQYKRQLSQMRTAYRKRHR